MPGPTRAVSMTAVTADETRGRPFKALDYEYVTAYVSGTGTIASGVISFEEASWNEATEVAYAGTWSDLGSDYDVTASDLSDGKMVAVHLPVSAYHFIRPFIETAIGGGGSVSVAFVGGSAR